MAPGRYDIWWNSSRYPILLPAVTVWTSHLSLFNIVAVISVGLKYAVHCWLGMLPVHSPSGCRNCRVPGLQNVSMKLRHVSISVGEGGGMLGHFSIDVSWPVGLHV